MIRGRGLLLLLPAAVIFFGAALGAHAFPVDGAFADMPKGIYFTGSAKPKNASTIGRADGVAAGGAFETFESGYILTPVGDGSWACTALVFPGATYTYTFEYRIPAFGEDTATGFTSAEPGGRRNVDYSRTITIPDTWGTGTDTVAYIYNTFQDQTVNAGLGTDSVVGTANTYLRDYFPTSLSDRRRLTGDADTGSIENDNIYNIDVNQSGDSEVTITFSLSPNGEISPIVQGDIVFDSKTSQIAEYGFRVLRAQDTNSAGFNSVVFTDITKTNIVGENAGVGDGVADTNISDSSGTFPDITLTVRDTGAFPAGGPDTWLYTVIYFSAYRHLQDTSAQNFGGGYDTAIRRSAIRVFFIVEQMNPDVVFPNGSDKGWIWVTPYIDGRPRYDLKQRVPVVRVRPIARPIA